MCIIISMCLPISVDIMTIKGNLWSAISKQWKENWITLITLSLFLSLMLSHFCMLLLQTVSAVLTCSPALSLYSITAPKITLCTWVISLQENMNALWFFFFFCFCCFPCLSTLLMSFFSPSWYKVPSRALPNKAVNLWMWSRNVHFFVHDGGSQSIKS